MFNTLRAQTGPGSRRGAFLLGMCLLCATAGAGAAADEEQRLEQLRARIRTLQTGLNEIQGRRDAVREEVRDLERRIGAALRARQQLDARLKGYTRQLAQLRTREQDARRELQRETGALERQLRAAYVMGRQEPLKLLLNQEDPARVARVLTYYRLLNQARAERLGEIQASLARLLQLEQRIHTQTRELESARAERAREHQSFETARARRAELLASLNLQARSQSEEIERLRADQKRLERLVGELQSALPAIASADPGARFGARKGRLPLPLAGRISARFGDDKGIGHLKWRGAFLAAREGQEVRAVHRGRVAYADWLRGFGLLLILEHGDGYMTLYGHNQSLYREVGDWVDAGQVIGAAGSTGDAPQPGVYFEIRHDGEPEDPLRWCVAATVPSNRAGTHRTTPRMEEVGPRREQRPKPRR